MAGTRMCTLCTPACAEAPLAPCCRAGSARVLHPGMIKHHAPLRDGLCLLGWHGGGSGVSVHVHPQKDAQLLRACPCFRLGITLGRTNLPINKMAVMILCYHTGAGKPLQGLALCTAEQGLGNMGPSH